MGYASNHGDPISIHPPREGWDRMPSAERIALVISIHPPREGWDDRQEDWLDDGTDFNPPTP